MAKKKKSLGINPEDRLVGIKAHNKQDLLRGCNEPGKPWYAKDVNLFTRSFCKVCRNHDCIRALGARTPWHDRMTHQVDYLINNPVFTDFEKEEHRQIASVVWDSLKQKAERLEIARQRQDWSIPDAPTDGINQLQGQDITDDVDDAVKRLARSAGKKEPELPQPSTEEEPTHFLREPEGDGTSVMYETQYPASSKPGSYRVWLQEDGLWQCECAGYKHIQKCKHLGEVVPWYNNVRDRQDREDEESDTAIAVSSPPSEPPPRVPQEPPASPQPPRGPSPTSDPRVAVQSPLNTPMPQEGVMIGDEPGPNQQQPMKRPIHQPLRDPWTPTDDKIVEHGARVVIKGKK